ncbi:MAG: hypothetical protein HC866_13690 [Leptolyngbyaceae cyanobacterium RU_5_1]|nr:hypothetical protein [Leptolyngbyaceae cyanobacterium RU_5_1]
MDTAKVVLISMVYSRSFLEARSNYGTDAQVLPMVIVRSLNSQVFTVTASWRFPYYSTQVTMPLIARLKRLANFK